MVERTRKELTVMSEKLFKVEFPKPAMPGMRGLNKETIEHHLIRFDEQKYRIVVPLKDKHGRIVGAKGREIAPNGAGPKWYFYKDLFACDPRIHGVWYGQDQPLVPDKAIILVEGEIDYLLLRQSGLVKNVWCSTGASLSKEQLKTLSLVSVPLVLFLDNDKAGKEAAGLIQEHIKGAVPIYTIADYCGEKDPGDLYTTGKLKRALLSLTKVS